MTIEPGKECVVHCEYDDVDSLKQDLEILGYDVHLFDYMKAGWYDYHDACLHLYADMTVGIQNREFYENGAGREYIGDGIIEYDDIRHAADIFDKEFEDEFEDVGISRFLGAFRVT